jgi:hypothetical protein
VDLNFSLIGWVHTLASAAAMLAFVPVMLARKGSPRHRAWGRAYAIAYLALCITAFGVYSQQRFWFPHWLAVGGLAVLTVGYLAVRLKPRGWRYVHLTAMLLSAYNLFGGAVNEAFLRIGALRALAGAEALNSPLVGMTHAVVMLVFLLLIGGYITASIVSRTRARDVTSANRPAEVSPPP